MPTFPILDRGWVTCEYFFELLFGEHDASEGLVGLELLEALALLLLAEAVLVAASVDVFHLLPYSAHPIFYSIISHGQQHP